MTKTLPAHTEPTARPSPPALDAALGAVPDAVPRGRALFAVARPRFWTVSLLPYHLGYLLATRSLVPHWADLPRWLAGALVIGPLMWLAVLAINDAYDLPGDLVNPRKRNSPLVRGLLPVAYVRRVAYLAGIVALAVAAFVGWMFLLGTLLVLLTGWAYSVPPLRLKARPGADVVVNTLAVGALAPLAGWCVMRGLGGFPWVFAAQGVLVGVALYIPTTLVDHAADLAAGYRTIAVRLGVRLTYRLGLAAWIAAAVLSVVLAAGDWTIPRRMLVFEAVAVPVLVFVYHRLLSRSPTFTGITVVASLFLLPGAAFAVTYTGLL